MTTRLNQIKTLQISNKTNKIKFKHRKQTENASCEILLSGQFKNQ